MVAIVIPAHNEERVLGDLLASLIADGLDAEIIVVANGCQDGTASTARSFPGVTVLETREASKIKALALGDKHATAFPRFYVDADVVLSAQAVRAMCTALERPGIHAVGPTRVLAIHGVHWSVRAYYAVWRRLPGVVGELYGRGVIGVDSTGHDRLARWPNVMADDLLAAMSFTPAEIAVVPTARVTIRVPRRYSDLLRRRTRAMTGNLLLARGTDVPKVRGSGTTISTLMRLARQEPGLAPAVTIFVVTAAVTKLRARWSASRGTATWLRDESSREVLPVPARASPSRSRRFP